jgi:N-acetylglutamate synthase-like GNAT family acetyltransferase
MGYDAVKIRHATIEDAEQISALTDAAYAQWVQLIGPAPLPMTTNYVDAISSHVVDVLENDGVMFGVLELVSEDAHALIENIAIHPDHQGRGFGRRLLKHAEKTAQKLGHSEVRLYTNALFTSNLKFYEAQGYSILETSALIPGSITVHLHKTL